MAFVPVKTLSAAVLSALMVSTSVVFAQSSSVPAGTVKALIGVSKSQLSVDKQYYISADGLNLRGSNSTSADNVIGQLSLNDQVEIVNLLNEATPLVQIKLIKSQSINVSADKELFVSKDYLSEKMVVTAASKYFVIQNIATEKTRVYERCTATPDCPHRLVFESDMIAGRPEEATKENPNGFKTWVGHGRISEWVKFYQDSAGFYPRWYSKGQDIKSIPAPLTDSISKLIGAQAWMVKNSQGKEANYGAFGWYAAKLTPEDEQNGVNYQWIHGTLGWGKDGDAPIRVARSSLLNIFANPGSHGCTRHENRAVAYMRSLLPAGTDVYRVYAREATREKEIVTGVFKKKVTPLPRYAKNYEHPLRWEYILTTTGAGESGGQTADAATLRGLGVKLIPGVNVIEQGTYDVDQYPTVVSPDYNKMAYDGNGDRYKIDNEYGHGNDNFRGYFLIDEGRFVNYRHPDYNATKGAVKTGGLADFRSSVPEFLQTTGSFHAPEIHWRQENNNNSQGG
jgi:hypothetical protein